MRQRAFVNPKADRPRDRLQQFVGQLIFASAGFGRFGFADDEFDIEYSAPGRSEMEVEAGRSPAVHGMDRRQQER